MTPVILFFCSLFAPYAADIRQHPNYKTWAITLQDGSDAERAKVVQALHPYGPSARPLLAALRVALQRAEEFATVEALAEQLARLGPDAKEAIPDLLRHLRQGTGHCYTLARAIAALGDPGNREALERCATHQHLRPIAIQNMELLIDCDQQLCPLPDLIRENPNRVLPVLCSFDNANNVTIRERVADSVAKVLGECENAEVPRSKITRSKLQLTTNVKRQVVALLRALSGDANPTVRNQAMYALAIIEPQKCVERFAVFFAAQVRHPCRFLHHETGVDAIVALNLKTLFEHLGDPCVDVWSEASHMIEGYVLKNGDAGHDQAERAARRLAIGLEHPSPEVRLKVLNIFWSRESPPIRQYVNFTPFLRDPDPRVRLRLAEVFATDSEAIKPSSLATVVQELASSEPVEQRVRALKVLRKLGYKARSAEALLLRLVKNPNVEIRVNAAFALQAIAPKNTTFDAVFEEALVNADDETFAVWQKEWQRSRAWMSENLLLKYRHGKPSDRLHVLLAAPKDF